MELTKLLKETQDLIGKLVLIYRYFTNLGIISDRKKEKKINSLNKN